MPPTATPKSVQAWTAPQNDPLWDALVHDSAAAVAVFDIDGHPLFGNPLYLRMVGVTSFDQVRGLSIEQRLGHEMAEERLPILREVIRTGKPVQIRDVRRGRALLGFLRKLPGYDVALTTFRPADIPDWCDAHVTDMPVVAIKHVDTGALAALSEREKEILAFIGQGYTSAQIAKKLHRTIKTIEWHRSAIAKKLQTKDRVALAKLAIQAGLCTPEFNRRLNASSGDDAPAPATASSR